MLLSLNKDAQSYSFTYNNKLLSNSLLQKHFYNEHCDVVISEQIRRIESKRSS